MSKNNSLNTVPSKNIQKGLYLGYCKYLEFHYWLSFEILLED